MYNKICICEHVEACHTPECGCGCPEFEEQDLILRTLQNMIDGNSIKAEHLSHPITIDYHMLTLLQRVILNLERENQRLRLNGND